MEVNELTLSEWETALPNSRFEVFHHADALEVINRYATGDLHLFGGYRGEELVGLLPVFVRQKWFATAVVSPPPGMYIPRLGPLLMPNSPKRRKRERLNRQFTAEVLARFDADDPFTLFGMICSQAYADPRPFVWEGLDVEPRFSYAVPLTGSSADDVLSSFSRSLRREIREGEELSVRVETGGVDAAHEVHATMKARYEEQDAEFPVSWEFTRDLVRALGDRSRVYVVRDESGAIVGGIIVLYSNDTAYFWQGGTRAEYEGVNVNSLLHWRIIEDAITDDTLPTLERYELGDADSERLARYKSKFNPTLAPSYKIQSGKLAELAQKAYYRLTQ